MRTTSTLSCLLANPLTNEGQQRKLSTVTLRFWSTEAQLPEWEKASLEMTKGKSQSIYDIITITNIIMNKIDEKYPVVPIPKNRIGTES